MQVTKKCNKSTEICVTAINKLKTYIMKFSPLKLLIFTKLFSLHLLLSVQAFSQDSDESKTEHLKVKRLNDSYIDVFYNKPYGKDKMPILLFCQGSGYDSNTEGFLDLLSQYNNKVVGLAIEKQGVKYGDRGDVMSDEYKWNNTIHNRVYDYLRVFQYLRTNVSWWNGELYIVGGSEGGLIAGLIASFYPNVRSVAILSFGGGLTFGEAWPIAVGSQKEFESANNEEINKEILATKDTLINVRNNPTLLKSYSGEGNTYAWWASIIDIRLANSLLDLEIPIFLGQGSEDLMAPVLSARKLNESFIDAGKTNLFYREYVGYDHSFTDANQQSHLVEVFMDAISWILEN